MRRQNRPYVFRAHDGLWLVEFSGTVGSFRTWRHAFDHALRIAR